jgi:hypothetical protein
MQRLSVRSHQNVNGRAPAANHLHFIRRIILLVDCLRARDTLFTLTFWLAAQFHRSMELYQCDVNCREPPSCHIVAAAYALPAAFNPRKTFSGLSGNLLMRTPVALKIALAMHAIGGTQAISPAPLAP